MSLFQSTEFKAESFVYIVTYFRLSMTKCLLVKWRHYVLNAHQLCVLNSASLITLLCLFISGAMSLLDCPDFAWVTARGLMGTRGRPEDWGEQWSWFWPRPWISEKNRTFLFVSYTWPRTQGMRPGGQRFLAHMVKNKQVALGIFFPAGLPLTIGQEWAFIKVTQPLINSY